MSTAAYNRSKIRHLPIHARDCAYYNWEPCSCGLDRRLAGQPSALCAPKTADSSRSGFCDRINIYDPSCWCNAMQMLQESRKRASEAQTRRQLSRDAHSRNVYAGYPSVMRTYHGERVIVPSTFPNTEPPYGWGFRNTLDLKEQSDEHIYRYLELLHNGAPFRNTFFKPAGVSGRNGVANGFWPFGGPK